MGSPDGGWYDDDPPQILGSTPDDRATNIKEKKITIYFNEFIKLSDATQNVIVSPPQLEVPEIKAAGKKIIVELVDTLKPNTTYTVDFSDAISDNNEGNPLGNYTYTFSTGEQIDTFEVSGYVISAEKLEPVKGILVGLYDDLADSAFRTKPMLRVSRTNESGHFVIKGVAEGEYRIYALQDADNDYKLSQKSEMLAFSHEVYKPWAKPDVRQDTIWRDTLHIDDIQQVHYTHYYPDDIIMLAFQEEQTDRFLLKTERQDADRIKMYFSYGNQQLPVIKGLNFNADSAFVLETSLKKDTLTYWLRDTTLVNQDTLSLSMQYLMTDSTGALVSQTDTIDIVAKTSYEKRLKNKQKEFEEWQKEQEKKKRREDPYDSICPAKPLEMLYKVPKSMAPNSVVYFETPTPLARLDTAAIHLYSKIDTLWYRAPFEVQQCDSMLRKYKIVCDWRPDTEYSFEIDTLAFTDIYGITSIPFKQGVKVKSLDEFSTLEMQLSGIADTAAVIVQLLDKNGKAVKEAKADASLTATFFYVDPGTYYVCAFIDRNGNGVWDTGLYDADRQAEDVYYYSQEIECKAKWDITKQWNVTAQPRNHQKPGALIKQDKGKSNKKKQNRNAERARQLGIEYVKKQTVK